jgi:hypothetical protein
VSDVTFLETKEMFLSNWKEGDFYDSSVVTYRRKMDVFFEFLTNNCGISDNNYKEILIGIGIDKISDSLKYYVEEYGIEFKVTVGNFFTVIKCYFDFISKNYNLKNDNFDSTIKFENLKKEVQIIIKKMQLNKSEQKSPVTKSTFNKILIYCNNKIDLPSKDDLLISEQKINPDNYNKPLVEFISAIITKIVMFTGVKNQVISSLKKSDYDEILNIVKVNNYWIHLPNKLGLQMKKYLDVWSDLANSKEENFSLFINKQGIPINKNYNLMFDVLQSVMNNRIAESVAKYTIMELMKSGINISIIRNLTSFGFETCFHCQELLNENKEYNNISENRYIDSQIRSLEIFDLL